jgi:asparagine synthase (glutamine-hydrolysing)
MCGICGIVNFNATPIDVKALKKMNQAQIHRGPDDEGYYLTKKAGLGFKRLSIIDLATGNQPMHSEDKGVWAVCNGEIYNYQELKQILQNKSHSFYTKSDAEVIVHLYEEYGEDFLNKLDGMFAIALWDEREKKIILARDGMGQKPLHYSFTESGVVFSSEIKSMLQHSKISKALDYNAVRKYFTYEFVPAPATIFSKIKKVQPGHKLIITKDKIINEPYWDIRYSSGNNSKLQNEDEIVAELDNLLKKSVKKRLISDVSLGAFLSGGLDSSYIISLMSELSPTSVKAFNIAFDDKSFDESRYAKRVAKYLGVDYHEERLSAKQLLDIIPGICDILDEPLADASIVPTYLLSSFTRQSVKVALSGDGGDELFAGYPTYGAHKTAEYFKLLPTPIISQLKKIVNKLPVSLDNFSFDFKAKKFVSGLGVFPEERHYRWMGSYTPEEKECLFTDDFRKNLSYVDEFEDIRKHLDKCNSKDSLEKLLYLDAKLYLQDDVLVKVDRASMANSLEVRSPFLDKEFVEFVSALEPSLKLRNYKTKYILKKAAQKRLPKEIINRPKKGFGIPVGKWINGELRPLITDILDTSKIKRDGIFNDKYVKRILDEHFCMKKDNRKLIWTLLIFQLWHQKYV